MRRIWLIVAGIAIALLVLAYQLIEPRSHMLFPPRAANGVEYVLYANVPESCRGGGCPALYLLDGERWLPTFARHEDALSSRPGSAPVVIVGIGYRDILDTANRRKHDFTPSFGRTPDRTGGADVYLQVLGEEIIPYAEEHLPISRGTRAVAGHSYAGLFAAYALMTSPDLFDGYIIISPALWFDDGEIFETPLAASQRPRVVFLAADLEGSERGAMANDVVRLNRVLLADPGVEVTRALMPNTNHNSVVDPAASRGLEALFGP
jgi:predicted alpha/beta superfamily hydrolase